MEPDFKPDGLPDYPVRHGHQVSWYREWKIEQLACQSEKDEGGDEFAPRSQGGGVSPGGNSMFKAPAYDSDASGFNPGSVRLLSSTVTGDESRPIYVLMMGEWESDWSWFTPFSNFTAPATDWEMLTNLDPQPLRVLQVWNARSCPDELLRRSWFVVRVDMALVESAKVLYGRMFGGGGKAFESLSTRIGTRVFESNDPRLEYLKGEIELLDHLTGLAMQHEEKEAHDEPLNVIPFVVNLPQRKESLALAAAGDSPDRELAFHPWQVEGSEAIVYLAELLGVPGAYTLRADGDSLGMLEGAIVFDGAESRQGVIQGGCAGSKEEPLRFPTESLRIELVDGQSVRLVPLKE